MSRLRATTPVEVDLGPCECPGTPHTDGDKAWLRPRLTAEGGLHATYLAQTATEESATYTALGMAFLVDGLVRWTLLDDEGQPVPTDEATLRSGSIDWDGTLATIAERGFALYTESVVNPLQRGRKAPSRRGRTEASTSPTPGSFSQSPTPSEPSTTPDTPPNPETGSPTDTDSST